MAYNQLPLDNNSGNTSYSVPNPSILEVKKYLKSWSELENYKLQEDALDKLFFELIPKNEDISDILLKVATLNDFYSTNIFSVYPLAKHILSIDIDERLRQGDVALVKEIQKVKGTIYQFTPPTIYRKRLIKY